MILRRLMLTGFMTLQLAACGDYGYRYKPAHQNTMTPIFADYRESTEGIDILLDTHGRRLTSAALRTHDGADVKPTAIDYPEFKGDLIGGAGPGWDEPRYTTDRAQGPTVLHFKKSDAGAAPWRIEIELLGAGHMEVLVGGPIK